MPAVVWSTPARPRSKRTIFHSRSKRDHAAYAGLRIISICAAFVKLPYSTVRINAIYLRIFMSMPGHPSFMLICNDSYEKHSLL